MASRLYGLLFVAIVTLTCVSASVSDCTYRNPVSGKTFNFSSLISPSGYYMFTEQVWHIKGFNIDSLRTADSQENITFYVQVCHNIAVPPSPKCKDVGAIYSLTTDECISWGNANVSMFDPNPYNDGANLKMYHGEAVDHINYYQSILLVAGANLKMYHGEAVDHINYYQSILYFVCQEGRNDDAPFFEHAVAATNQAHFKFFTKLAC